MHAAHSPARSASLSASFARNTAASNGGAITPGGYMRDCRRRAKLSLDQVANKIALQLHDRAFVRDRLAELEANKPGDYLPLVESLRRTNAFPFSFATFSSLAAQTIRLDVESFEL